MKTTNKKTATIKINFKDFGKNKPKAAMLLPEDKYLTKDTEKKYSSAVENKEANEAVSEILSTTKKDLK